MKKLLVVLLVLVACFVAADDVVISPIGDWQRFESGSLLDAKAWGIGLEIGSTSILYRVDADGRIAFGVGFPDYVGTDSSDARLIYVTDEMAGPVVIRRGLRVSDSIVILTGFAIGSVISDLSEGTMIMFRTYTYRDRATDAAFTLVPEDTARAVEWLESHLNGDNGS